MFQTRCLIQAQTQWFPQIRNGIWDFIMVPSLSLLTGPGAGSTRAMIGRSFSGQAKCPGDVAICEVPGISEGFWMARCSSGVSHR